MKEAQNQISTLVKRFERNIEAYRSPAYNETQLRIEFIDPFFEALGWDVPNKAGYAEQYKDVIHEDAIKIAGATKAPDYCFRIGGLRKFFLETESWKRSKGTAQKWETGRPENFNIDATNILYY